MHTRTRTLIVGTLISLILGCASDSTETILPQDGPTMKQVYDHHFTGEPLPRRDNEKNTEKEGADSLQSARMRRPLPADYNLDGYTREAHTEINQLFPRLSNPTLVMYIYPHLSGPERHPVPGYSTAFTLYEKVEYALPGEIEERY